MRIAIGIDTGGTCTDAVAYDYDEGKVLSKGKTLTTKEDLSVGIAKALDLLPQELIRDAILVSLSTTLATNACVEDKGARSKLIIFGLTDELMERLKVEKNYGIRQGSVKCIDTHSSADGLHIDQPDWDELCRELGPWIEEADSMAAAELFGPTIGAPCEKKFKDIAEIDFGKICVCACGLTDRIDVIQRGATALLNARLLPIVQNFIDIALKDLSGRGCKAPVMVVRSDGSFMSTDATVSKPIETILSGPAASILAGKAFTKESNYMVVDMGGTTTDVSMVIDGVTRNADAGISIGSWKTSVGGVFVDTFALGGDSTLRVEKGELKIFPRRAMPLCTAASRWPSVKVQLAELLENVNVSTFPLHEMLLLLKDPSDRSRYSKSELELTDILKDGPRSLWHLREQFGVDLYYMDTERLEEEGVIIRCGMTPTDCMHIKGDYTEYDREASLMAAEFMAKCGGLISLKPAPAVYRTTQAESDADYRKRLDATITALADKGYDLVEHRMYSNLTRILLSKDAPRIFKDGVTSQLQSLIDSSWEEYKLNKAANSGKFAHASFNTDLLLLGMGAPTHVFLPRVAEALGTRCIMPENAEIGNAIGAVMGQLVVRESVEITQWDDAGIYYLVHTPEGTLRFDDVNQAAEAAKAAAAKRAVNEAIFRGASGELKPTVTIEGNSHDGYPAGDKITYGGYAYGEVRYSPAER